MSVIISVSGNTAKISFDDTTCEAIESTSDKSPEDYAAFVAQDVKDSCQEGCAFTIESPKRWLYQLGCTACEATCFRQRADDVRDAMRDMTAKHLAAQDNARYVLQEDGLHSYETLYRHMLALGMEPKTPGSIARARDEVKPEIAIKPPSQYL
jgi:hypothetical protein